MTLRDKAEAAADMAFSDVTEQHKRLAEAIKKLARKFAEKACMEFALTYVCTAERLPAYRYDIAAAIAAAEGDD